MTKIIGRLKELGIAIEGSRGIGAAPQIWVPKASITFEDKANKARSLLGFGSIAQEGNVSPVVMKYASGQIDFDLMSENFGYFLLALLGTVSTSGPTDSAYTHNFSLEETNQHDSLALVLKDGSIDTRMYKLAMIESMTISIVPDDVVKVTANFMSKQGVTSTGTPSYSAESKFVGRHLSFKIATNTSGLAAASNIPLRRLTLNINKNLRLEHNTGTVGLQDILNQAFSISGEVELDYEGRTYADLMRDGSYRATRIQLVNGQDTIGGGSTNPSFTLDLSRVDFNQWEAISPNDEVMSQTFQFMAMYDLTNGNLINNCQLVNATSGYAAA